METHRSRKTGRGRWQLAEGAAIRRVTAASFGKMPTTSVRRLISPMALEAVQRIDVPFNLKRSIESPT
jgi:hypothetical protein